MDAIFGLAIALPIVSSTGVGVTTAVAQGVSQQRKANEEAAAANPESRMIKFNVSVRTAEPPQKGHRSEILDGGIVVLRDDKLWVEERTPSTKSMLMPKRLGSHPFTGFFLQYPDEARLPPERGLVSTITVDPPMLNWIYVDKDTSEFKYSNRSGSIEHLVGEWDWTDEHEDSCLSLDGWEGFVAVEEKDYLDEEGYPRWSLYYDVNDDGLKKAKKGRKTMEVILERKIITDQEVNQWGVGRQGNIGLKSTREV